MDNNINYKTLLDFSNGKYSYNEYLKVRHWFTQMKNDVKTESQLFEQWKKLSTSDELKSRSLQPIFEKIQYHILLEEKQKEKKRTIWFYYKQAAAVLIPLFILSVSLYFLKKPSQTMPQAYLEINVPQGARVKFLLPDSTSGWLNSGAKLRYPAAFGLHRTVELTGEAFFNVKHREHSDFTVRVADMYINDLGTQFNVSAYDDDAITEVVLKEGEVEVNGTKDIFNQKLLPGEKITYNRETHKIYVKNVDPKLYSEWTKGYLVIDNETLSIAAKKLERWYNVEIDIESEVLKNYRFKATFNDEPLDEVLRFIAMTTPITYEIATREQDSDGIVKQKKIIIRLKR